MNTGIKPKRVTKGRLHNEHARRYMFNPLKGIDFASTQFTSPVYNPKFPKSEIVLLESFPYMSSDDGMENYDESTGKMTLVEKIMGTDAQVKFIMGGLESGYAVQGMAYLDSITDFDTDTVIEIQNLIFNGVDQKKMNLVQLQTYLTNVQLEGELAEYARKVVAEMLDGVNRAISYCRNQIAEIENEINNSRTGKKLAMKSGLDVYDKYLYNQIGATPNTQENTNTSLIDALRQVISPQNTEADVEVEMLKRELQLAKDENARKDEAIKELAGLEEEDVKTSK